MGTNGNGYIKWWHFITALFTVIGLAVTITIFTTSSIMATIEVVRNEACRNREAISTKVEKNTDCFHRIDKRLARIENKLGIN